MMIQKTRPRVNRPDSGVALILVLLAILVLSTLAAAMVFSARSEIFASYNFRIGTQAEYVARAGVQRALNFFNSAGYVPLPPPISGTPCAAATVYYNLNYYATNPVCLYFSNTTPVTCGATCSGGAGGNPVVLATSTTSNYPPSAATPDSLGNPVNVVSNWSTAMNGTITDPLGGTGNFAVTATLQEYHTVNNAFFGVAATGCADAAAAVGICRKTYEVWQVVSTGTWNSNIAGGGASPTVQVVATIAPLYVPYFGNSLYGLCSVTLSGTVCTDSYNSSVGIYGGTPTTCPPPPGTSNASLTNAGIGANGGVTISGGSAIVAGNVTFANSPPAGCTASGFTGSTSGVKGSILPGPPVPTPPAVVMPAIYSPTCTPSGSSCVNVTPASASGGSSVPRVANIFLNVAAPPAPPPGVTTLCPVGFSAYVQTFAVTLTMTGANNYNNGYSCVGVSGSGTSGSPYLLGNIAAGTGAPPGVSSNDGTINIIGPTTSPSNPIYLDANLFSVGTNGSIYTTNTAPATPLGPPAYNPVPAAPTTATATALVIDVASTVSIGGTAAMNYNSSSPGVPSPDYLTMNVLGTGTALSLSGQASLTGMINVPNGDASLGGSGSSGTFFGSILAQNVTDHGNYPVHYDVSTKTESGQLFTAQVVSVTRPKM